MVAFNLEKTPQPELVAFRSGSFYLVSLDNGVELNCVTAV